MFVCACVYIHTDTDTDTRIRERERERESALRAQRESARALSLALVQHTHATTFHTWARDRIDVYVRLLRELTKSELTKILASHESSQSTASARRKVLNFFWLYWLY